jgi:hypothetical protein
VLTGEPRPEVKQVALSERAVARFAHAEINAGALLQVLACPHRVESRREAAQASDVSRDVGQLLRIREMMLIAEVLHPLVPALVVSEVDELLEQHRPVLAGNGGNGSVRSTETVAPVAGGAGFEENRSVRGIGRQPRGLDELLPRVVSFVGSDRYARDDQRGEQWQTALHRGASPSRLQVKQYLHAGRSATYAGLPRGTGLVRKAP